MSRGATQQYLLPPLCLTEMAMAYERTVRANFFSGVCRTTYRTTVSAQGGPVTAKIRNS